MRIEDIGSVTSCDCAIRFSSTEERIKALEELTYQNEPVFGDKVLSYLKEQGFYTAPASTKWHGAYEGGLFDHSFNVAVQLQNMTQKLDLKWQSRISPIVVGILHDLCKIDIYKKEINPEHDQCPTEPYYLFSYEDNNIVKGHGIKSVVYAQKLLELTPEEEACIIYHMGAYTPKEEWNDFGAAIEKYPNVLFTHTADMIATRILGV